MISILGADTATVTFKLFLPKIGVLRPVGSRIAKAFCRKFLARNNASFRRRQTGQEVHAESSSSSLNGEGFK